VSRSTKNPAKPTSGVNFRLSGWTARRADISIPAYPEGNRGLLVIKSRGFTLLELMIVVAVIAILAAIALPSYFNQVRKSRRSEVEAAIQAVALAEERVRGDCASYKSVSAAADWTATTTGCSSSVTLGGNPYTSSYYTLSIAGASATGYTISAAPVGSQANDKSFGTTCGTLSYALAAGTVTKSPVDCWAK